MNDERETRLEKLLGYLKSDPDNITLLFEACDLALESGGHEHARALLVKLLQRNPDHAGASYRMAQLLFLERRFEESLALTGKILETGEQHPAVRHRHALSLVRLNRFEEAALRGEWDQAKTLTATALRLQPQSYSARYL
ncbi:MAG: hypothetical protein JWQ23_4067 [Herminiimonas sp.]|nr:hypothetical protein [Herminiimonas sp.]